MASSVLFKENTVEMAEYLSKHPEDIDIFWQDMTPLIYEVGKGRTDVVDMLIAFGANVNMSNTNGWTALHYCCYKQPNNRDILQRLLKSNGNVSWSNWMNRTPLHYAAFTTNDVNIIHDLTLGSNPNLQNKHGDNPLMEACCHNKNPDVISALINITNDINATNQYGNTALYFACFYDNYSAIPSLLAARADMNIINNNNKTAYEYADLEGKRIIDEYVKLRAN